MKHLPFVRIAAILMCIALPCPVVADGHKTTMWDTITNDERFATFAVMVENAGVEHLFNGEVAINATVYVPTNLAFSTIPSPVISALRVSENKNSLVKLIKSHYFIGTVNDLKEGDYFITTNMNGDRIRIEQDKNLFVKDMIIQDEPILVGQSKIVPVQCVMFVQPSISDHRLSLEQQERFRSTSCCLRTMDEATIFLQSAQAGPEIF